MLFTKPLPLLRSVYPTDDIKHSNIVVITPTSHMKGTYFESWLGDWLFQHFLGFPQFFQTNATIQGSILKGFYRFIPFWKVCHTKCFFFSDNLAGKKYLVM